MKLNSNAIIRIFRLLKDSIRKSTDNREKVYFYYAKREQLERSQQITEQNSLVIYFAPYGVRSRKCNLFRPKGLRIAHAQAINEAS